MIGDFLFHKRPYRIAKKNGEWVVLNRRHSVVARTCKGDAEAKRDATMLAKFMTAAFWAGERAAAEPPTPIGGIVGAIALLLSGWVEAEADRRRKS